MKSILLLIAITISTLSYAQKSEILNRLKDYNFSEKYLTSSLNDADATHSFDAKTTTVNGTDTKIQNSKFNPNKPIGERWELISVNGEKPSNKDIDQFNTNHNATQPNVNIKVDENSWGIEKDDKNNLIISFKYEKSSLPKKYSFLGDCNGLAYFNKQTKMLEKTEFVNEKPIRIKIFNVIKLDMIIHYTFNESEKVFLIDKEDLRMGIKFLGKSINVNEITAFSNYKKVK